MFTPDERLRFCYTFMKFNERDIDLDFWQNRYIRSMSRFSILVKSRRTGFSFVTSMKGVVKAIDPDRVAYTKQFVSYNESDAVEKINYAAQFYESLPGNVRKVCKTNNKTELDFIDKNGKTISRLISIPCRPPRGKGGDIALDEYAIYLPKMSDAVYTAALPVISRGGCIEMGSSPLGKIGKFYEIYSDKEKYKSYERYNIPWWFSSGLCVDVPMAVKIAPEMTTEERVFTFGTDIIKEIYNSMELEKFQQEYECRFIDEAASYIPLELIYENTPGRDNEEKLIEMSKDESITDEEYWEYNRGVDFQAYTSEDEAILQYNKEMHGSPLFLGFDVAKHRDAMSIYLIGMKGDKKRSFARIERKGMSYEQQGDIAEKLFRELPIYRGAIDRTGSGDGVYERLYKKFGDKIDGVYFTPQMKEQLAIEAKRGLEQHEFALENNKDFHSQIHSIKRMDAVGKYFRYDAERNEKGHADSFWAWALANFASMDAKKISFYKQYASQKSNTVVQSVVDSTINRTENEVKPIEKRAEALTHRRGKSLDSVMRGFTNAWNK